MPTDGFGAKRNKLAQPTGLNSQALRVARVGGTRRPTEASPLRVVDTTKRRCTDVR